MAIDGSRIQRVTKEGLFYLDETGQEKFISFAVCHLNYVMEFVDRSQSYSREERQEEIRRRRGWKCVADRGSGGYPFGCYGVEFYTNPPILFEFPSYEIFRDFYKALWEYGWATFDRS